MFKNKMIVLISISVFNYCMDNLQCYKNSFSAKNIYTYDKLRIFLNLFYFFMAFPLVTKY